MVAVSALAHLCLLFALGVMTPRPNFRFTPEPLVEVRLIPRIEPWRTHASRQVVAATKATPAGATAAPSVTPPQPHLVPPAAPVAPSAPPLPSLATAGPEASKGAGDAPGPIPHGEADRGVGALLRGTVGCDYGSAAHLTAEEKAACIQRFGEAGMKAAPFSGVPPEKQAYYAAVQQRYYALGHPNEAFARKLGEIDSSPRGSLVGSVLPIGAGCAVRLGKKDKRSQADRIRQDGAASIDVGPLKCGVAVPSGTFTPEAGIPQSR